MNLKPNLEILELYSNDHKISLTAFLNVSRGISKSNKCETSLLLTNSKLHIYRTKEAIISHISSLCEPRERNGPTPVARIPFPIGIRQMGIRQLGSGK